MWHCVLSVTAVIMLLQRTVSCFGDGVLSRRRSPYTEQHIVIVVCTQSCNSTLTFALIAHRLAVVLHFTANRLAVPRSLA